ncbi:hypothetical protein PR048_027739 [Dryococelus australis]|uniref:Uncharacterized protein n=1 Tax=Dryococelus australis TaxID=614101 RepID=A0ABQ9GHD6_9NEOP|nr:hypothetical protein PR048_027739 [Dryococelus australis]
MSCNIVATTYKIPEATLGRYLNADTENLPVHAGIFRKVFCLEHLENTRNYLTEIVQRVSGLTNVE